MNDIPPNTSQNKQVYERLYGRELTNQEFFDVKQNLMGFFEVLIKLDRVQKERNKQVKGNNLTKSRWGG